MSDPIENTFEEAKNALIRKVSRRERSSLEIREFLESKGFSASLVQETLSYAVEQKWVDDERFAKALVRHQSARGKGASYIQRKLREKGLFLKPSEIEEVTGEYTAKSETERAVEILERRFPKLTSDFKEKKKAFDTLVRRGFSFEVAKKAVQSVLNRPAEIL